MQRKVKQIILYIITLVLTMSVSMSVLLLTEHEKQENKALKEIISEQGKDLQKSIDELADKDIRLTNQLTGLSTQLQQMQEQLDRKVDKVDRGGERGTKRIMEVTAYWEGSCGKAPTHPDYGITASGRYVQEGFIAAGPELAIGQEVYIPYFDRTFTVMDRGSAITNGHLDIYMTTYKACMEFGRRELEVWVVE